MKTQNSPFSTAIQMIRPISCTQPNLASLDIQQFTFLARENKSTSLAVSTMSTLSCVLVVILREKVSFSLRYVKDFADYYNKVLNKRVGISKYIQLFLIM